jgi:hypothetical protein
MLSVSSKLSNKNKEDISMVSHVSFPLNKIKIIRLTFDDLNREKLFSKTNEQKINSIHQQSSSVSKNVFDHFFYCSCFILFYFINRY